ncbi:portal protein [Pseudanabaena phage Pam1]|uniref:Pam1 portal proteins n=1 Tax=unidentified TaxID=32644 RepID=UPI001CFC46AE|nr:Chain A, Pam1 portal proteins [unidentified]7EEP_B Chain B, Pam1 portal proteins [unidentified]7EEP_C Chain C, Pam1 portal proteins [unidentified]7EEP_D Chain D, Pam1 portal proteins [unidentified]7EEP_E Chain E, Pam1 portal proteins [unidentified]7EEP_F Chain F, Pam1 portal proteins [unidentified]7EEP_G Chain G, Pam1 portal proteins [unidentified]7EEP_H Chain H, Pam1 portal proteins [unidentified]7EEP_I Chain I, Pam1 portal proteins [unidentified]7EEP_J Chain J, Pam1 portal proteins [u
MEDTMTMPSHAQLKAYFEEARDANEEYRKEAFIDRDYFDGHQWTEEELQKLEARKQPATYFNEVKLSIRGLVGVFEQGDSDPRAWPRNPQDEDSADIATKALRYVKDYSEWSDERSRAALNYFVEGTCAAIVGVDENGRPEIEPIRFEEFFHDPRSRELDFSDARFKGVAKWRFADEVGMEYGIKGEIDGALDGDSEGLSIGGDTFGDRPDGKISSWIDSKLRRVFVVEMYVRWNGVWIRALFWGRGILEMSVSAYLDRNGKPTCPIEARSCYIDRENRRYGEVRDLRSPQDAINKRESKLLHMLNNRQAIATNPEYAYNSDAEMVRKEMSKPDGIIPPGWQPASMTDLANGQFALLSSAREFIQRIGQNPSVLAAQSASASGRAQLARQQAGMVDSAMALNGLRRFELAVYRQAWLRCRQFWKAPDYIRVTDDEGAPQFVGINQPIKGPPQPVLNEMGQVVIAEPILGYENALAELDVDINIDAVPDTANLAQEQFLQLTELARLYGPQEVPFDDLLELSSMPEKTKLIAKRRERSEQMAQVQAQQGQMQEQIAMQGAMAEIENTQADTAYLAARAQNEMLKPQIEAFKAGFGAA